MVIWNHFHIYRMYWRQQRLQRKKLSLRSELHLISWVAVWLLKLGLLKHKKKRLLLWVGLDIGKSCPEGTQSLHSFDVHETLLQLTLFWAEGTRPTFHFVFVLWTWVISYMYFCECPVGAQEEINAENQCTLHCVFFITQIPM